MLIVWQAQGWWGTLETMENILDPPLVLPLPGKIADSVFSNEYVMAPSCSIV